MFRVDDLGGGVLRVAGDLDLATLEEFERYLEAEECPINLDLSDVSFMDIAALSVLLRHRTRCAERGEELRLVAVSDAVTRLLRLTELHDLLIAGFN
jgi:anti-anti-sigma factor